MEVEEIPSVQHGHQVQRILLDITEVGTENFPRSLCLNVVCLNI